MSVPRALRIVALALAVPSASPAGQEDGASEAPRPARRMTLAQIDAAIDSLATDAPELVHVETLGTSASGHPIRILVLTRVPEDARAGRPTLLVLDAAPSEAERGAEGVLAVGRHLVEKAQEPTFEGLLEDRVVVLAPALDPDVRRDAAPPPEETLDPGAPIRSAPRAAASEVRFERNFPLGWLPASLRPGSGDVPLARPATRVVASWLAGELQAGLIVSFAAQGGRSAPSGTDAHAARPWPGAALPASDEEVLAQLTRRDGAGVRLLPWGALGSPGGGLLDFAYQAYGIFAVAWEPPNAEAGAAAAAAWEAEVGRGTAEMLQRLPRVRLEEEALVELAPGLWQLDLALRNTGHIPSLSALGARLGVPGELELTLRGARLVATARRGTAGGAYREARLHTEGEGVSLGDGILGPGETRYLCLVLEAEDGARVELLATSTRAGSARLELVLE